MTMNEIISFPMDGRRIKELRNCLRHTEKERVGVTLERFTGLVVVGPWEIYVLYIIINLPIK